MYVFVLFCGWALIFDIQSCFSRTAGQYIIQTNDTGLLSVSVGVFVFAGVCPPYDLCYLWDV